MKVWGIKTNIRPYVSDIINNDKVKGEFMEFIKWRIHSGNIKTEHKTQGEWKIHLIMAINFISSNEDSDNNNNSIIY